jgi:hypothetical protein
MGAIAGAAIGAGADIGATAMQTNASIKNTNATNQTNLQIAQDTNKTNAENVAATNQANLQIAQDTNKMNFEIAQMGNEYNEKMLERQIQQEWDMWNAQNEYNSLSSQMQRAREAGINPYVATGLMSAGTAGSMTAPSAQGAITPEMQGATMQAAQAQGATMMPADFSSLSGLRGIASNFIAMLQAQEDVKGKQLQNQSQSIENDYKAKMFEAKLANYLADTGLKKSNKDSFDIMNKFKPEMLSSEIKQRNTDIMFRNLQAQGQMLANMSSYEWYKALPQQIKQTLTEQMTRINNLKLQGHLTQAQVNSEINKAVTEFYKGAREQQNFEFDSKVFESRIKQIESDLRRSINNEAPDGAYGLWNVLNNGFRQFHSWFD